MKKPYLLTTFQYHFCLHFPKYLKKSFSNNFISFFQEKKLLYNAQYSFRTEHFTELTALELISYYGINGVAYSLIESYLTNRKRYVDMDDVQSEMLMVNTGVPQESTLGPLLFIIYVNDMANSSNLFIFRIYAYDTRYTLSTKLEVILKDMNNTDVESKINLELGCINDWLKCNKLSMNISKCKYLIIHKPQKRVCLLQLNFENTVIDRVGDFDFLGLTLKLENSY